MVVNETTGSTRESKGRRAVGSDIVPRVVSEVRRADEKLVAIVIERPVATLCAAAIVGYLFGRVLTRMD